MNIMTNHLAKVREGFKDSHFSEYIGLQMEEVEEGRVTLSLPYLTSLENIQNTVHGGIYATVLDTTMGMTCRSLGFDTAITIQMSIQFLKSVSKGTIYSEATVINQGRSTALVEGRLFDEDRNLIAYSTGTFRVSKGS